MNARLSSSAALIAVALAGCGATASQAPATTGTSALACASIPDLDSHVAAVYTPSAVSRVEAIHDRLEVYETPRYAVRAYQPTRHIEGASLYVAAPANASPAFVERALSCHAAGAGQQQYASDPLRVPGVRQVDVAAEGPMLRIDIRAHDRASGEQVLAAARGMQSSVGITQLAAADSPAGF